MLGIKNKAAAVVAAAGLSFAGLLATAGPASAAADADGYDRCPYGRVCFFEGWNGTGEVLYATKCGDTLLGSLTKKVSSIATHGNGVQLWRDVPYPFDPKVGHVGPWTRTNLSQWENDQADAATIEC
ncbi:peptidase inhibitor family I36 protein [Streptomyces sp. NPDC018352]|uniref:peptidase inhibitor family I36 protein n=1 Tax=Streptomyces sp. NPDC018352 TaxID=3157194 RepID=UPI0033FFF33C